MSFWQRVADWLNSPSEQLLMVRLPSGAGDDAPLRPEESYVRLWLSDVFTARDRGWGRNVYPVVHASIRMRFAGQDGTTFTTVAGPPQGALGPGVWRNYALTGLLPFYGGQLELQAGLSELKGESVIGSALEMLQSFSGLIGPPLGAAIDVAQKVSTGLEKMFDAAGGDIVLGLHDSFVSDGGGGNVLRPGYVAVIAATANEVDPASLRVVDDGLHVVKGASSKALEGFNYMLFRIEGRPTRDTWDLPDVVELRRRARAAVLGRNEAEATAFRAAAIAKALDSPDLTWPDQQEMARRIDEDLKRARGFGQGAAPEDGDGGTLDNLMAGSEKQVRLARSRPRRQLEDYLLDW